MSSIYGFGGGRGFFGGFGVNTLGAVMPNASAPTSSPNNTTVETSDHRNGPMPVYEIEQYELHTTKYRVEADSEAQAIAKLFNGEADPVDNSLDFIEVADDYGLPVDQNRDLAEQLPKLGVSVGDDIIGSIRSIEEAE